MITAFTGLPGQGKTLSMTYQAYKFWKKYKCPVYANYSIRFPLPLDNKQYNIRYRWQLKPFGFYKIWDSKVQEYYYPPLVYGSDFLELFKQVKDALILIDEAGSVFDNRKWQKFDTWIMRRFRESRHHNLEIMYTAQNIKDVDAKIRQLTNFESKCKMWKFRQKPVYLINKFFHNEVITNDTEKNRKLFHIMTDIAFKGSFESIYNFYDTYEDLVYESFDVKDLSEILKKNKFEKAGDEPEPDVVGGGSLDLL